MALACILAAVAPCAQAAVCDASNNQEFRNCAMSASAGDTLRLTGTVAPSETDLLGLYGKAVTIDVGDHGLSLPSSIDMGAAIFAIGSAGAVDIGGTTPLGRLEGMGKVAGPAGSRLVVGQGEYSGSIQGVAILQLGAVSLTPATLVLSGTNDYVRTFIHAGTLQVGGGGASGNLGSGEVVNDGTLAFSRSDTLVVGNMISGTGQLRQDGSGTLELTGANTYSGGTHVTAGTLAIGSGAAIGTGPLTLAGGQLTFRDSMVFAPPELILSGSGTLAAATGATVDLKPGSSQILQASLQIGSPGNAGTIRALPTAFSSPLQDLRISNGTFVCESAGSFVISGTLAIEGGALLDFVNAGADPVNPLAAGTIAGAGDLRFNGGGRLLTSGGLFSGRILGDGGLQLLGLGSLLTLTGANAYKGATDIYGNTLEIGDGGTTGSLGTGPVILAATPESILDVSTLVFNRADDVVVGNFIGGEDPRSRLRKRGAGRLTLTADSPFRGATSVEAGALAVDGSLASSAVDVFAGATLGGNGQVGKVHVAAGGFLNAGNSIGRLTTGDLVLVPGSTLQVEANAAGKADRVDAANITVSGANVQVLAAPGQYARNTRYTILTHSGSRSGTFSGVTSNLAFLTPSLVYEPGVVFLDLSAELPPAPTYAGVATTSNQRAVANYLQAFANSPGTDQAAGLISVVDSMDAPQARRAFETMAGSAHISATQVAQAAGRNFSQMLSARGFDTARSERLTPSAGFTATVQGAKDPTETGSRRGLAPTASDAPASSRGLWAQAIGGGGRSEGDGGGDLRYSASGLIAGFDHDVNDKLMLGLALGRTRSHWTSHAQTGALGSGGITSYQAGIYARYGFGVWKLGVDGSYGLHRFTTNRTVDLGIGAQNAASGHRAKEFALGVQAEYAPEDLRQGQWQVRPIAGLRHAKFDEDGFTESGTTPANLTVAERKLRSTTLQAGAKLLHAFEDGRGELQLQATLSHLSGDNDAPITARMAGQAASFTASGTPLPRGALTLSAAASRQLSPTLSLFASAAAEHRGSGHSAYSVVAGLRKRW